VLRRGSSEALRRGDVPPLNIAISSIPPILMGSMLMSYGERVISITHLTLVALHKIMIGE